MGFLLALSCALILYGTLYPFSFRLGLHEAGALSLLAASVNGRVIRGDTAANIILFLPFGFFAMQRILPRVPRPIRLIFVVIAGAAFSFGIECVQSCLPGRSVSIYDIAANTAGALFGAVLGWKNWRRKFSMFRTDDHQPAVFPFLLLGAWFVSRLIPFVLNFNVRNVKDALKPLLFGGFSPLSLLHAFIITMVVCLLVWTVTRPGRVRTVMAFIPLGVIAAKPFIISRGISQAEVLGTLLGIIVWWFLLSRIRPNTAILALLLTAHIIIQELVPFVFTPHPGAFSIIPFGGLLKAVTVKNLLQFTEKVFLYGSFLWLLVKTGLSLRFSLIFSVALLTGIELMQMFLVGHVSDITNPTLVVILGAFLYFLDLRDERP